jgi:hypothetical protein
MEIWKEIPGFEGLYEASTYGRIKSLPKEWLTGKGKGIIKKHNGKILNQFNCKDYKRLTLYRHKSGQKSWSVHRLIALTFIPNPNNYPDVMHLDDNPSNNHVDNLRWGTEDHNMKDMLKKGRFPSGFNSHISKYSIELAKEIKEKFLTGNYSYRKLAREYNISSHHTVINIIKRLDSL